MIRYIGKRLLIAIPTIILISMFVFALQKLLPGVLRRGVKRRCVGRRRSQVDQAHAGDDAGR